MGYLYTLKSNLIQNGEKAFESSIKDKWPDSEVEYGSYEELEGGPYAVIKNSTATQEVNNFKYAEIIVNNDNALTPSTYINISDNGGCIESDKITLEPITNVASSLTTLDLGGLYAEIGHNVDLSQYISGWSVNSFCNYMPALQSQKVADAKSYYTQLGTVKNGYITNTNINAAFMNNTSLSIFTAQLPNLYDAAYAFAGCANLKKWTAELPSLVIGHQMFYGCTQLAEWNVELPNLDRADQMFYYCNSLLEWNANLPKLTNGSRMFQNCVRLGSVNAETPLLSNANSMYQGCQFLETCDIDYSNITECATMFGNTTSFTTFNHDLPKCTKCYSMFYKSGITSFESVMSSMVQDGAIDGSDSYVGDENKGFWKMFEQCASINSVIITTNADVADYVNASNLKLRTTKTWIRTTETLENGLIKITLS